MPKIAILSHILPPSPSGQSVILYRILSYVDPSDYYLIASQQQHNANNFSRLQSQVYTLPAEPALRLGIQNVRNLVNLFTSIITRTGNLLAILRREPNTTAIIACTGDLKDIPAAFLTSRIAHIPYFAYIFDDYVYQWTGKYRLFAKQVAPIIFNHSAGIIGPNEFICEEYRRRYNVNPTLVRNPCDKNELEKEPYQQWPAENGKIKIIFTGAIYHANYDCFRNLLTAMDTIAEYTLELHIFTDQTREQLQEQGIAGEKLIIYSHVPYGEILEQQRKADILFLPLAFDSPIPEVIRTSAPGKMGEYLASGRPILAYIPADSFVAYYCGKYECAAIVSQNNVMALAQEIRHIISDDNFRARVVHKAISRAQADFHPQQASEKLIQLLSGTQRLP
jgi:glycosyltransferase involved in cell wall biosynthesis